MENFQKVLLSLAEQDDLHTQGYSDLDQGQREPPHKYDQLTANPPPDDDVTEEATYVDPTPPEAYIEPLPPLTSDAYIEPLPPLST